MIFKTCQNGNIRTTLCLIEAGSALDCSEKMSCDSFGNLILRSNVVPNAQLVTFDRLGLNSVLFLANFLTYTKVRFIANFFQWNTLEPSFPFKLPEKRPQKIDGLKAIAYQMTACMHIGYAICNTSVFLLCICCNRLPFWVYCVWKRLKNIINRVFPCIVFAFKSMF